MFPAPALKVSSTFLCTACVLLSLNGVKFVESDALPGRSIPIKSHEKNQLILPNFNNPMQPAVDKLLAHEPNCSRWIWGSCYFNHGICGEGKQHATRSGDGCNIIGITSRCWKECPSEFKGTLYLAGGGNLPEEPSLWGVNDLEEEDKPNKEEKGDNKQTGGGAGEYQFEDPGNEYSFDYPNQYKPAFESAAGDEEEGDHCRWKKAKWGPCKDGIKIRVRVLRKNRDHMKPCPTQKRDTKACGTGTGTGTKPTLDAAEVSKPVELPMDAPCKWNTEVKKCGKCEKSRQTCVMPLTSGNPAICGDERKDEFDCE